VVELVGICGYCALISMTLNTFARKFRRDAVPFKEPA
jgi:hypothetical protein